jgi:hypothetical protein
MMYNEFEQSEMLVEGSLADQRSADSPYVYGIVVYQHDADDELSCL